jgi:hypothetical protein
MAAATTDATSMNVPTNSAASAFVMVEAFFVLV